jgi:ketosteroid isomerase-like protein
MSQTHAAQPASQSPIDPKIETVQGVYQAFFRRDLPAVLEVLTDDVDWEAATESAPWYGRYRGKAEVPRFFQALGTSAEVTEFEPLSYTSNETDVMVAIRWTFKSIANGKAGTETLNHWWRFDGDKISFYRGSGDDRLYASIFS